MQARLTPAGRVRIEVTDRGRWRDPDAGPDPDPAQRGLGLAVSRELVDDLDIATGPGGTTATVEHRLTRPARLLTDAEIVSGTPPKPPVVADPALLLVLDQPADGGTARVRIDGPLDAATAPALHAELRRRTHGGSRSLIVDLTGVTHLASAGVSVLHQAVRDAGPGTPLRLYAPPGSTAGHVLDLVVLPHETRDPHAP